MSDATTQDTTIEVGTHGAIVGHDGIWEITAVKAGWYTVARDGEELKVRANAIDPIEAEDDEDDENEQARAMSKTLNRYKGGYKPTTAYSGAASLNNGDLIARTLAGATPEVVALLADRVMGEEDGHHAVRYASLNPGQIRMNSGNRVRAYAKRGDGETAEVIEKAKALGMVAED